MRRYFGLLVVLFVPASAAYGQTVGANLNTGIGVGVRLPGGTGNPGGAGAGGPGASIEQRAAISVGGRGPADVRAVGANFNSVRLGAGLGGSEGPRMGASAVGTAGFQMRRDERTGEFRRGNRPDDDRRPEDRRSDDRRDPDGRPTSPDGGPAAPTDQAGRPQDRPYDPRLLPALDAQNRVALQADLFLANRLAEIDRLRDVAVSNNDAQMLLRADHLELEARRHHGIQVRSAAGGAFEAGAAAPFVADGTVDGRFQVDASRGIPQGQLQAPPDHRLTPPGGVHATAYGEGAYEVREFPARASEHASPQGRAHASDNARPFMPPPVEWPHRGASAAEASSGIALPPPGEGATAPERPRDDYRRRPLFRTPSSPVDMRIGAAATAGTQPVPAAGETPAAEPAPVEPAPTLPE